MNPLDCLTGQEWARLVHALLHSLWQGALIAAALAAMLRALPARKTDLRYAVAAISMALLCMSMLMTWSVCSPALQADRRAPATAFSLVTPQENSTVSSQPFRDSAGLQTDQAAARRANWTAWLAALWLAGATLMLARAAALLAGAGRLRRVSRAAGPTIEAVAETLRVSLGIARRVGVVICDRVVVPAAMGVFRPLVLLPASALVSLTPEQLRAILAHELAHIRRHDYLVNIVQLIFEALLFFNPAAWWISRQIRREREACCDALATAALGGGADYAEALAECAIQMREGATAALPALTGGRDGGLLDRILRLTRPDYRPRLRLPWHGIVTLLCLSGLLLACLGKGTEKAVEVIAHKFVPAEKVRQMETIKASAAPSNYEERQARKSLVHFVGSLRTTDGGPVPKSFDIYVKTPFSGLGTSGSSFTSGTQTLFHVNFDGAPGEVTTISISDTEGEYAPAQVTLRPEQLFPTPQRVEFALDRGFSAQLEIVDPDNKPIADAQVGPRFDDGTGMKNRRSNAAGIVTLEHVTRRPMSVNLLAPGFEHQRVDPFVPDPSARKQIRLTRAAPLHGVVLDAKTGKPLDWAQIRLLHVEGTWPMTYASGDVLATTDDKGEFALTSLRADSKYWLLVDAPDHEQKVLERVNAASGRIEARLGPALYLRGRIIGPIAMLGKEPSISYARTLRIDNSSHTNNIRIPIEIQNGEGLFRIQDPWPGEVKMELDVTKDGEKITLHRSVEVKAPVEDYVIDLNEVASRPQRRVAFKFAVPQGGPAPHGLLDLQFVESRAGGMNYSKSRTLNLDKGENSVDVPVPTTIRCDPKGLVGYTFDIWKNFDVPAGDGPFEATIPLTPAGMIHGKILSGPKPAPDRVSVFVEAIDLPKNHSGFPPNHQFDVQAPGRFASPSLPLEATYAARFTRGNTVVESDPIRLDAKTPMAELTIKIPDGKPIRGRVVDESGQPVANIQINLGLKRRTTNTMHTFGFKRSDNNGEFDFEGVNPEAGKYSVRILGGQDYQPAVVSAQPGGPPLRIEVRKGYTVSGIVRNRRTGKPVPDQYISAWVPGRTAYSDPISGADTRSDSQGRFTLRGLGAYEYKLNDLKFNAATQTEPLEVLVDEP
ncbi:MAG: M56 family metallopeptidase [Candidatus Sumerlaeia bacterium]